MTLHCPRPAGEEPQDMRLRVDAWPRRAGAVALAALLVPASPAAGAEPLHGIAMHGAPLHPPGFASLTYVNPEAPKGGRLRLGELGDFDSLNPFIIRGSPAAGLRDLVFESLLGRALDEPFSLYGLIAETLEVPADRSSVTFNLDRRAQFSDGHPVTSADVVFSFEMLRDKGLPNYRAYYAKIERVEIEGPLRLRFVLKGGGDREMPLILGLMPIVASHKLTREAFDRTSLVPPVGSGPYTVAALEPGRSITYRRNPAYWARDLAINRGKFNFDEVRFSYYLNGQTLLDDFTSGRIHFRSETDPRLWATAYRFPAVADGRVIVEEVDIGVPAGMSGFVMNTRRGPLADQRVRQALILAFDADRINRNLFHGLYARTQSYFERSLLSSSGRPADQRERSLLAPWLGRIPADILEGRHRFPEGGDPVRQRRNLQAATAKLAEAGYRIAGGVLIDPASGRPVTLEIMVATRQQERLAAAFVDEVGRLGLELRVRSVDAAQYQARLKSFDFDIIQATWPASLSPGNEQANRFGSESAGIERSFNWAGVRDPAVDAMIEALLAAEAREDFVSAVRALDRVLIAGDYVVPLFHLQRQWIARWRQLERPATTSLYGYNLHTWWSRAPGP